MRMVMELWTDASAVVLPRSGLLEGLFVCAVRRWYCARAVLCLLGLVGVSVCVPRARIICRGPSFGQGSGVGERLAKVLTGKKENHGSCG